MRCKSCDMMLSEFDDLEYCFNCICKSNSQWNVSDIYENQIGSEWENLGDGNYLKKNLTNY